MLEDRLVFKSQEEGLDLGKNVLDEGVRVDVLVIGEELLKPSQSLHYPKPVVGRLDVSLCEIVQVFDHFVHYGGPRCKVENGKDDFLNEEVMV